MRVRNEKHFLEASFNFRGIIASPFPRFCPYGTCSRHIDLETDGLGEILFFHVRHATCSANYCVVYRIQARLARRRHHHHSQGHRLATRGDAALGPRYISRDGRPT